MILVSEGPGIETIWCVSMSETCFRIRYPPYAGPLHLTDFQRATLALGLCIRSYGLAQAIFTLGEKLQFFPQLRGRQHWTICSSLHNCVLAKLHCCAQIQQRDTLKNISLHVHVHTCAYLQLIDVLQYAMCTHRYITPSTLLVYCFLHVLPYVSVCQRHIFLELDFYGYAYIAIGISTQDIDCSNKHEEELLLHFILKPLLLSAGCASF